jgi:hypothetical protein
MNHVQESRRNVCRPNIKHFYEGIRKQVDRLTKLVEALLCCVNVYYNHLYSETCLKQNLTITEVRIWRETFTKYCCRSVLLQADFALLVLICLRLEILQRHVIYVLVSQAPSGFPADTLVSQISRAAYLAIFLYWMWKR